MSTQRGNASRSRPPKHQNKQVFNNLRFDSNHRSKLIANTDVVQVCEPCQNIIEWKIKYKKYKPLTQPKTCTKCHQKTIKNAYHIVCIKCSETLSVCCKCGKQKEIVKEAPVDQSIQMKEKAALEAEVLLLPVRRRRTFQRYMDNINGVRPKKTLQELETEEDFIRHEQQLKQERASALSHAEYMQVGRAKLEELKKNTKLRHSIQDDFDDMGFESNNDDDDDDEPEDDA